MQKVRSLTAKEIIMTMVESLRNPVTDIRMTTYGHTEMEGPKMVCFGCAATNTIARLLGANRIDMLLLLNPLSDINESMWHCSEGFRDRAEEDKTSTFVSEFEIAINFLRLGSIASYNIYAKNLGLSVIQLPEDGIVLYELGDDYTENDLQSYVNLANKQES